MMMMMINKQVKTTNKLYNTELSPLRIILDTKLIFDPNMSWELKYIDAHVCSHADKYSFKDARSVSLYNYNQTQILQYFKYAK